jgi:uncharacterized UBP type Zn finger protein
MDVASGNLMAECEHLSLANPAVKPLSRTCQQCVAAGQRPVELRMCLICGNVACCDSTPGRHATKHFHETGHPVIKPYRSNGWLWCYVHQSYTYRDVKNTSFLDRFQQPIRGFVYSVKERLSSFVGRTNN